MFYIKVTLLNYNNLFNFNLAELFRGLFCGGGGGGGVCIQLVRIMLEIEIWYVSTNTYVILENIPFSTKNFLILLMSAFFLQIINIFCQM